MEIFSADTIINVYNGLKLLKILGFGFIKYSKPIEIKFNQPLQKCKKNNEASGNHNRFWIGNE
jgi:hypothetical protein